jgi:hypothetical protein
MKEKYPKTKTDSKKIKVRIDKKTTIVVTKMSSFKLWKQRYPQAEIID